MFEIPEDSQARLVAGVVALFLVARTLISVWLDRLNLRRLARQGGEPPEELKDVFSAERFGRAVAYTRAKIRFGFVETAFDVVWLIILLFMGLLAWLYTGLDGWLGEGRWMAALTVFLVGAVLSVPGMPLEWWSQFRIEEAFGFNKSTQALWWRDKIVGLAVSAVIGIPVLWVILWLFDQLGGTWWLWAGAVLVGFQIVMLVLYPMIIIPLFNKLSPLEEGELRDRLLALADRTGFKAKTIQVIDGSKRSAHANAFFTGFGRFRRIVLYDTLIEQLEPSQIEAVLAHEIGHYKKGHIPQMLLLSAATVVIGLGILALLVDWPAFYQAFAFPAESGIPAALLIFSLIGGFFGFWFSPLFNALSRRNEYQADRFAREAMGGSEPLLQALGSLHDKNLSNPVPHPLYSFFHYSHPTLLERRAALKQP